MTAIRGSQWLPLQPRVLDGEPSQSFPLPTTTTTDVFKRPFRFHAFFRFLLRGRTNAHSFCFTMQVETRAPFACNKGTCRRRRKGLLLVCARFASFFLQKLAFVSHSPPIAGTGDRGNSKRREGVAPWNLQSLFHCIEGPQAPFSRISRECLANSPSSPKLSVGIDHSRMFMSLIFSSGNHNRGSASQAVGGNTASDGLIELDSVRLACFIIRACRCHRRPCKYRSRSTSPRCCGLLRVERRFSSFHGNLSRHSLSHNPTTLPSQILPPHLQAVEKSGRFLLLLHQRRPLNRRLFSSAFDFLQH